MRALSFLGLPLPIGRLLQALEIISHSSSISLFSFPRFHFSYGNTDEHLTQWNYEHIHRSYRYTFMPWFTCALYNHVTCPPIRFKGRTLSLLFASRAAVSHGCPPCTQHLQPAHGPRDAAAAAAVLFHLVLTIVSGNYLGAIRNVTHQQQACLLSLHVRSSVPLIVPLTHCITSSGILHSPPCFVSASACVATLSEQQAQHQVRPTHRICIYKH